MVQPAPPGTRNAPVLPQRGPGVLRVGLQDRPRADIPARRSALVRIPPPCARPVPDDVWREALAGADARVALMMRLTAEAGLRRAEVAAVHLRDVVNGCNGANLVVCGKGGRTRIAPISDELAATLRRGAAGHTPELASYGPGWVFPAGPAGGHISAHRVGKLVAAGLPPGWSMHKLRHRFGDTGRRLSEAGWESVRI